MRVLFALNYINSSKQISKLYKKNYKESLDIEVTSNKLDTFKLLKEMQFDVLIINSKLNGQAILFSEINYIFKSQLAHRIIFLMDNDDESSELLQRFYNLGVLDALYEEDSTNINISELINKGRDLKTAKEYYNASDEIDLLDDNDIDVIEETELLILLEKMKVLNTEFLIEFLNKLQDIYSDEQLKYLIDSTDLDIRGKLIETEIYNKLVNLKYTPNEVCSNVEDKSCKYNVENPKDIRNIEDRNQKKDTFISDIEDDFADLDDVDLEDVYTTNDRKIDVNESEHITELEGISSFYEKNNSSDESTEPSNSVDKIIEFKKTNSIMQQPKVIEKIVEIEKIIEKIIEVEKVVEIEKIVEVEKVVEKVIEIDKNVFNRVIVGVIGVKKGIGTTYNAISLAMHLSKAYKVAVVEFKKDFLDIAEANETKVKDNMFTFENVDYFSINIDELYKTVLNLDYQYIIVDFGAYSDEMIKDFYRSDIKLVLCGTQIWEDKYLSKFLTEQQCLTNIKYIFNLSNYKKDLVENMEGLQVYFVPYFELIEEVECIYNEFFMDMKVYSNKEIIKTKKGFIKSIFK